MRSVSQPEKPPKFFIDRSLGRLAVPQALRDDGWDVIALAEHYGMPADQRVADTEWIEEAAKRGWPILMKDKRIRTRKAEIEMVVQHRARCFVIARGDLSSAQMVHRFLYNRVAIFAAVAEPGPYIYSVQADRILRLHPSR
jgi:PIN like domain